MPTVKVQRRHVCAASVIFLVAVAVQPLLVALASAQSTVQPMLVVASSTATVGTGLNQPQGVGVDASGNVFVASANSGTVVEFPAAGGAGVTIISGLSYNKGLAVDSLGNVYSTSYGGNVTRRPAGGGPASKFTTGSTCPDFAAISALTVDAAGNLYVTDKNHAQGSAANASSQPITRASASPFRCSNCIRSWGREIWLSGPLFRPDEPMA